jgi:hypothetical protein
MLAGINCREDREVGHTNVGSLRGQRNHYRRKGPKGTNWWT